MSTASSLLVDAVKDSVPGESRILLAVSGGVDSMALLHCCCTLQQSMGLQLYVAHVDHGLRPDSALDASFVQQYCEQRSIAFFAHTACIDPADNLEAAGRKVRYDFFASLRARESIDWILTAHTKDDLIETFLMRILSNKEPRSIMACDHQRRLLRPFLMISKSVLRRYAEEVSLSFREDSTNSDNAFLRNRVRNELLPFLETHFGASIPEVLFRRAMAHSEDLTAIDEVVEQALSEVPLEEFPNKNWFRAMQKALDSAPKLIAWRLVESAFRPCLGFSLGRKHSKRLLKLFQGQAVGVQLPTGVCVRRSEGGLQVEKQMQ